MDELGDVDISRLPEINAKLEQILNRIRCLECEWLNFKDRALFLEDVIKSHDSPEKRIRSALYKGNSNKFMSMLRNSSTIIRANSIIIRVGLAYKDEISIGFSHRAFLCRTFKNCYRKRSNDFARNYQI